MDRQRLEEKGQSQALQKGQHTEGRGPVCCLPLNVREARAQMGLRISEINVNQNTARNWNDWPGWETISRSDRATPEGRVDT